HVIARPDVMAALGRPIGLAGGVVEELAAPRAILVIAAAQRFARRPQRGDRVLDVVRLELEQLQVRALQRAHVHVAKVAREQRAQRRVVPERGVEQLALDLEGLDKVLRLHGYHSIVRRRALRGAAKRWTNREPLSSSRTYSVRPERAVLTISSMCFRAGSGTV